MPAAIPPWRTARDRNPARPPASGSTDAAPSGTAEGGAPLAAARLSDEPAWQPAAKTQDIRAATTAAWRPSRFSPARGAIAAPRVITARGATAAPGAIAARGAVPTTPHISCAKRLCRVAEALPKPRIICPRFGSGRLPAVVRSMRDRTALGNGTLVPANMARGARDAPAARPLGSAARRFSDSRFWVQPRNLGSSKDRACPVELARPNSAAFSPFTSSHRSRCSGLPSFFRQSS